MLAFFLSNLAEIILAVAIITTGTFLIAKFYNYLGIVAGIGLVILSYAYFNHFHDTFFLLNFITFICLPAFLLLFILLVLFDKNKDEKNFFNKDRRFVAEIISDKKKIYHISDVNRGIAVFGSSGSGKTAGPIFFLLQHYAKYKFTGIIHDYKDFELTEIAYPLFEREGINFKVFCPHDVNRSVRINPIAPELIDSETTLNGIIKAFVLNLAQTETDSDAGKFFRDGVESLLAGVIWRLRKDYPDKCNLPFVIAFLLSPENHHEHVKGPDGIILTKPFQKLIDFLCQDKRASLLASVFLTGLSNEREIGSLYSTLAANLRQIATPELFYLLGDNEISLDLNSETNRTVLSFVNKPGSLENIIAPVNAMLIESCFAQMSEHGREPSFAVIDEAPTIKMMELGRRIATLRSYGLSFVYCLQDKVSALSQFYGKEYKIKEILTNLSTQFMGKVNDPDTAKHYEKYFEIIQETQKSFSFSQSEWLVPARSDGTRVTESTRRKSKIEAFEFFQLKQGEFIMFSDGVDKRFRFFYKPPVTRKPALCRSITPTELGENFNSIINEASNFLNTIKK